MTDLERRLHDLGHHLAYPPTPAFTVATGAALPRQLRSVSVPRRLVAAGVVAALAVVFGVPPVRTAIAHWLGITGVVIQPVRSLPPVPTAASSAAPLGLGAPTTLAAAEHAVGFHVLVPSSVGRPDEVDIRTDVGPAVTLVYRQSPSLPNAEHRGIALLVTEFRGSTSPELVQKFVGPGTTVTAVTIGGASGFWISGVPHEVAYQLPDGSIAPDSLRVAGPTLILQRGAITVRIEGAASEAEAMTIARSLG
jgi:hypothetical protein